jgi:hypothetical protein
MPPQQAYGLLGFVDYVLDFRSHLLASLSRCFDEERLPVT